MRDITLEDTIFPKFTTRAFASGIPTVLAGTPVISAYEDGSLTQITAGITLGVDHDSVVGLNMITVVATAANGYENSKEYQLVITTGTVGGVSVVGEVVYEFTVGSSAAAVDLANGTDGLGAIKTDTAAILTDTADIQPNYATATALATVDTVVDGIQTDLSNGTDGLGAIKADTAAILLDTADIQPNYATATALATVDTVVDGIQTDLSNGTDGLGAIKADTAAILTDTADIQPNYATSAALATVDTVVDSILVDTAEIGAAGAGLTALATAANLATVDTVVDTILVDTAAMQPLVAKIPLSDGTITWNATALASVNAECDTAITDAALATAANLATVDTVVDSILVDTAEIGVAGAGLTAILTTQMTEAYAADGTAPTLAQAVFLIQQTIGEFAISGTTITAKKLDGSATAATYTLDDGTDPTSRTRTT